MTLLWALKVKKEGLLTDLQDVLDTSLFQQFDAFVK